MPEAVAIALRDEILEQPDLRRLYDEHAASIRGLLRRLIGPGGDADDLLQDVFLLAWRKRDRVPSGLALPWLRTIAIKVAADARRRARFRRCLGLESAPPVPDWNTPERAAERKEASRVVYEILDRLSEKRRTVFILYEMQGLSGGAIAEVLDCPLKTVWTRLYHARREFIEIAVAMGVSDGWPKERE